MKWKHWKRAFLLAVGLVLLAPVAGFIYLATRHFPEGPELRAFFAANREGFACVRREIAATPTEEELLVSARACGLNSVVGVHDWAGSHRWRLIMYQKARFFALSGLYDRGFALRTGGELDKNEQIVTELGAPKLHGDRFVPLEDGWALYETGF